MEGKNFLTLVDYAQEINQFSLIKKEAALACSLVDSRFHHLHKNIAEYALAKAIIEESSAEEDLKSAARMLETVISRWKDTIDSDANLMPKYIDSLETLSVIYGRLDNAIYAEQFKNEALKLKAKVS